MSEGYDIEFEREKAAFFAKFNAQQDEFDLAIDFTTRHIGVGGWIEYILWGGGILILLAILARHAV